MKFRSIAFLSVLTLLCSCRTATVRDGNYTLDLFATNDVHGRYFDSLYVGDNTKSSLLAVSKYVNGVRAEKGAENVILIDAGDILQGDNASYYFNYVDTKTKHICSRMLEYMKYDAFVVGNHDIETGHDVYDRVKKELKLPMLAANAISDANAKPYFQDYTILNKNGIRVAVIGFTNPNIKNWLSPEIWSGMTFTDLMECVQADVDRVVEAEKPHVVVVATHSGTGRGNGSSLEAQGLDLLKSLKGVDIILCSHDHRACTESNGEMVLLNSGSHCRKLSHGIIDLCFKDGELVSKEIKGELVDVNKDEVDEQMREYFRKDYEVVKAFTLQEVGALDMPLYTQESFKGQCDYMNLIHNICLSCTPAQLSFAAPLTFRGKINEGTIIYNDLFTIYPYENQLFVVKMTGKQIENYLEYSYDHWINTISSPYEHALKIVDRDDPRTGARNWSFVNRSYNFDSLGGANYTVDITKPYGDRIEISTLADGSEFDPAADYYVAMTSYRASGGGELMSRGAGIDNDNIDELVVERYPEIRELLYNYLKNHVDIDGVIAPITSEELSYPSVIGSWSFVPSDIAGPAIDRDYALLFDRQ